MFIPDPGSDFFPSRIRFFQSRIRFKEVKYFNPKTLFLSSRKYDPGCSSRIRISDPESGSRIPNPDSDFLPIPYPRPRSRGQKGTGSRIPHPQHCVLGSSISEFTQLNLKISFIVCLFSHTVFLVFSPSFTGWQLVGSGRTRRLPPP
jgi:hypothetical protein